jgi:hypothetical protein
MQNLPKNPKYRIMVSGDRDEEKRRSKEDGAGERVEAIAVKRGEKRAKRRSVK